MNPRRTLCSMPSTENYRARAFGNFSGMGYSGKVAKSQASVPINRFVSIAYSGGPEIRARDMPSTRSHRILLGAREAGDVKDLRVVLEQAGYVVEWRAHKAIDIADFHAHDLVMVDDGRQADQILETFGNLRSHRTDHFVPFLFITPDPTTRLVALEGGADACVVRPFATDELLAQVRALLRLKQFHDRLSEKSDEFHRANKRLHRAYQ